MTTTRLDLFSEDHVALAAFASALSHPARIMMVTLLQQREWVACGDIVEHIPLAQATVSQHLKVLVDVGLLSQRREKKKMLYHLNCEKMKSFCHHFQCTLGTQTPES
ncbi:metalloregulator ArsR/SmtB family transcription factor [Kiritimatiellota bacterium B12222]|nr:metalloregulator ArsR/SmtB family transcription factor [Kiritimatiellota bacterium B12222]